MKKAISRLSILFVLILGAFQFVYAQTPTSPQLLAGSGTFTVPCGVTSITVSMWGGGGGGASDGVNNATAGAGGGSAGFTTRTIAVTPGVTFTYSVGGGGSAGNVGTASTFVNGTGPATNMSAGGGGAGVAEGGAGGAAGAASGGTTNTVGATGSAASGQAGGNGGSAPGGGAGGTGGSGSGFNGAAGTAPGGGGGGSGNRAGGGNTGGAGGAGRISISFTVSSAGTDITVAACATTATMAATAPSAGTGTWTCITNCTGVAITTPTSATSGITGLTPGTNTTLRWTVTNAGCTTTSDDVVINTSVGPLCPSYCNTGVTSNPYLNPAGYITSVAVGTINNATGFGASGYSSLGTCATVVAGVTYPIVVQTNATQAAIGHIMAYADWNADGDFADAGEAQTLSSLITSTNRNASGNIVVPAGAVCGATIKFRIMWAWGQASTPVVADALCGRDPDLTYGETEDYCFTISCAAPSCTDGILNQTETSIDCGGVCPPCAAGDCNNGVMDGTETGIDCGGTCPLTCTTNTTVFESEDPCDGTSIATVYVTNCDQVGTSAYDINSPDVRFESDAVALPTSGFNCTAFSGATVTPGIGEGTLAIVNLDPGVDNVFLGEANLTALGMGNSQTYVAAYQGNSCGALTFVGCKSIVEFESGTYFYSNAGFTGLDDTKDLYLYTFNGGGKNYTVTYALVGSASVTSNVTCATAAAASGEGCNLGAPGATWNEPELDGTDRCGGGGWNSNDNTTYYSFTADATSGSLEIDGVTCNDGTTGAAQFAVWTSCAAVGTYGAGFLGCQVGTSALSLSPLVDGNTYYIAVDGTAGDNCVWTFSGTGIILPITYKSLEANHYGSYAEINWITASESNNDYFTVQRTLDGVKFENIETIDGAGNSKEDIRYSYVDSNPYDGVSYYRIKQTDFDGKYKYSDIKAVSNIAKSKELVLAPNPATDLMSLNFGLERTGDYTIRIVDYAGRIVFEKTVHGYKGDISSAIDLSEMDKGLYNLILITGEETRTSRFQKL